MLKHGSFVISLDFEMMWGCHDWSTTDEYGRTNVRQVRQVISRLLTLFDKYDVNATFATVGLILCKDKMDALNSLPKKKPSYSNPNLSPYKHGYINEIKTDDEPLYFAPDIIEELRKNPHVEIGTHTFSHYFCWAKGQSLEEFKADLSQMRQKSAENDLILKSIVFPKNEISEPYIDICRELGITSYRGNAKKYYNLPKGKVDGYKHKICRFADAYLNIGGYTSINYSEIDPQTTPMNVRASRFLRPYSPILSSLEKIRLRRIKKELLHAAKEKELYHLWWHPHNFGANMDENLHFVEEIFKCYQHCKEIYGMKSYTMSGFVSDFISN